MMWKTLLVVVVSVVLSLGGISPWIDAGAEQATTAARDGTVNINTASKAELMALRGIGPVVAERIVEYRKENGPFKKTEEIQKVRGVGERIWEANRNMIRVK